jgi:hypothetical protein
MYLSIGPQLNDYLTATKWCVWVSYNYSLLNHKLPQPLSLISKSVSQERFEKNCLIVYEFYPLSLEIIFNVIINARILTWLAFESWINFCNLFVTNITKTSKK